MAALLLFALFSAPAFAVSKHVVVVAHSYNPEFQWVEGYSKVLNEELSDIAELHHIYLDTKRIPRSMFAEKANWAMEEIVRLQPELVIAADDNALQLLGQRVCDQGIPLVFLGINSNPRVFLADQNLATGVLERPLIKRSVSFAKDILGGDVDKCLILFEDSTTSRLIRSSFLEEKDHLVVSGVMVDLLLSNDPDAWKEMVLAAPESGYDFLILGTAQSLKDDAGFPVLADDIYRWVAKNSTIPVFCFWEFAVGPDMCAGGYVTEPESQGVLAADFVRRILQGEDIKDMYPKTARQGAFVFSRKAMARWGLVLPERIAARSRFLE